MKKLFTNLKAALTLLLLCGVCSVWGETVVASYYRSETTNTTSGGTFTQNLLGQSGYYQDNSAAQTYYMQLKDNSAYWTTAPQSISFSAKLGGGSTRDPLGDGKMYVVLLDSNGNEISATTTEVTNKITNTSGSEFAVEITSTANVYGVKLYHSKIASYNIRYYSMSLSYEAGGPTPSKTLSSIAVSNQKTSFYEGDDFEFGGTVTASYEENDAKDADVTSSATFSGYDMNTIGEQTVTASYTEGEITKTATYQIIVNARPAYTVTLSDDNSTLTETTGGDGVVLPSRTSGNPDYTFAGWSTTNIPEETTTTPTVIPAGTYHPTGDIILYPVYVKQEAGGGYSWNLVTDVTDLEINDFVIIAAKESDYAISTTPKDNNRGQASITKSGGTVTLTDDVQQLTLRTGNKDNTFAFYTGSGYLYAASSSNNYMKTETNLSGNSSWVITISGGGVASIIAQGVNTRNVMQYNESSSLFSCYSSASQKALSIYKKTANSKNYYVSVLPVAKELESISLSGEYPTEFWKGEAFSHEGMTVTAHYSNAPDADVTNKATFEGYDMTTVGEQTVTVTYDTKLTKEVFVLT